VIVMFDMETELRLSQVAAPAVGTYTKPANNAAERKQFIASVFLRIAYSISTPLE
jgi:hypothetical protein